MGIDPDIAKFDGVGLVHKLCLAWRKANGLPADMNTLAEDPVLLEEFIRIIRGESDNFEYKIDGDAEPRITWNRGAIMSHQKNGPLTWDDDLIQPMGVLETYGSKRLNDGLPLKEIAEGQWTYPHPNACILDFLERHPGRIPKKWDPFEKIFFLGTQYRFEGWRSPGRISTVVRCLERGRFNYRWSSERVDLDDYYLRKEDAIAVFGDEEL